MKSFVKEQIYVTNIQLPQQLVQQLDLELEQKKLGPASNFLCFKRRNSSLQDRVHVDSTRNLELIHASIVVPVEGCRNSYMYWVDGQYRLVEKWLDHADTPYADIEWQTEPRLLDKVEINSGPMLARVDLPHSATSNGNTYRTILSIRLKGNPSFEEVVDQW